MNWLRHNRLLGTGLSLFGILFATQAWLWSRERRLARRELAALERTILERDRLARQTPALSRANEQAIAQDLANTREGLAILRAVLLGRAAMDPTTAPLANSIDLYFELEAFVEKTRAFANQAHVAFRPDERFGFASHANKGPAADLVPAVRRQQLEGQYLIETLIGAQPQAIVAIQREHPLTSAQRIRRNQPSPPGVPPPATPAGNNEVATDFFELDGAMSIRVPGLVDSDAFRLVFTGRTPALRAFLNRLATSTLPVIVRSVEVEPLTTGNPAAGPAAPPPPAAGAPVPLVAQNLSRLAVVVEFVVPPATPREPAS